MEFVRSDTPDVARRIASAGAWASRNWHTLGFAGVANVLALLIALVLSVGVSVRAAASLSVLILLALNGYLVWRAQAAHRRWVAVGRADRLYIRLFAWRRRGHDDLREPDVLVLEGREIASMSARTVEVFLDGSKPRIVDWLVIEPSERVADAVSSHVRPLLTPMEPDKAVLVAYEEGRLTIEWKWWRPALPIFLEQVARACPRVAIGREERSELDLNGIWRRISRNLRKDLGAQERQMLVQAKRLGFGCNCAGLLSRYKNISFRKAGAYLAEIEREETETGRSAVQQ